MYDNPNKVLDAWLAGVNVGEAERVLALYSEKAVLLPTFSDKVMAERKSIREYFYKLADQGVSRVVVKGKPVVQSFSDRIFSIGGLYDWEFTGKETVRARFTFTVNVMSSSPILHHHSSVLPEAH